MRKTLALQLYTISTLLLVIAYIYHHTTITKAMYRTQQLLQTNKELLNRKDNLEKELHILASPQAVHDYALKELEMKKMRLNQIQSVSNHESN